MGLFGPGWTVCGRLKFMLKFEYTLELLVLIGSRPLSGATCLIVGLLGAPAGLETLTATGAPKVGDDRSLTAALTALLSCTARSCSASLSATVLETGVGISTRCSSGLEPPPSTQLPHLSAT
jgi:hypothetical protein